MKNRIWLTSALVLLSVNCTSWPRVVDNQKIETELAKSVATANQEQGRLNNQLKQAKVITIALEKQKTPGWSANQKYIKDLISKAQSELNTLKTRGEELSVQRADFAAFAHAKPQVHSRDPQWSQAEQWQNTLNAATTNFNSQLEASSLAIQNLYKFMTEKSLYQYQEPSTVGGDWPQQVAQWRTSVQELVNGFNSSQTKLQKWYDRQPASDRPPISKVASPLSDLTHDINALTQLIKEFDDLNQEYLDKYARRDQISNIDPHWGRWMDLQKRHAQLIDRLEQTQIRASQTLSKINQQAKN